MNYLNFKAKYLSFACVGFICLSIGCGDSGGLNSRQIKSSTSQQADPMTISPSGDVVEALREAIARQDWSTAGQRMSAALIAQPSNPDVLTDAAMVNAKLGRPREAAQLMVDAVRAANFDTSGPRVDNAIRALLDVGQLYDAIDLLEQVIAAQPSSSKHRRMLIGFLGEAQLPQRMAPHIERLIRDRQIDIPILVATTETFTRRFSERTIEMILERNPTDRRPRLGLAQQALERRDDLAATAILKDILQSHPQFAPAHAMLGQVMVDQHDFDALATWIGSAPTGSTDLCDYWLSLGDLANFSNDIPAAMRCYGEATQRNPNNPVAWARLGQAIRRWQHVAQTATDEEKQLAQWLDGQPNAEALLQQVEVRGARTLDLRKRFHEFSGTFNRSQRVATGVAQLLFDLGRTWEAEAWSAIATTLPADLDPDLPALRAKILAALAKNQQWFDEPRFPELAMDYSALPLPQIESNGTDFKSQSLHANLTQGMNSKPIQLADEAVIRGLQFFGKAGDQVNGPNVPLAQTLGCGGAALDYDNDGQTDLYFASAGGTPRLQDSAVGAMFRNLGGNFADVSLASKVLDHGFGQGVSAGDYNDDGFVDLWLLNLGVNHLFRNNGDGTFADVTASVMSSQPVNWSSSGAMLDVDGDGWNDLIAVNYCVAQPAIGEPCFDEQTKQEVPCHPLRFPGSPDEFIQGRSDGTFTDVSAQWSEQPSPGRGLGIIAGKLDGKQVAVYIANDMSANDYYVRNHSTGVPALFNVAIASGVAVDAQTLAQASMGMATSDLDNDGDLDFYITGFAREYNIVYEQQFAGSWTDSTAKHGLVTPTLGTVGFGTVANDLDGDGIDELLVTNGHIGDFGGDAPPYAQPFQLFRRSTSGQFMQENSSAWAGYFSRPHVGRAMWMLDVDSDGRSDNVVTHENEPVSLLMNRSAPGNQFIGFRLVSTQSTRDAVGAIVQFDVPLESGVVSKTLFSLAGSGYLCSSDKVLRCGTGTAARINRLRVTWPDGRTQDFGSLPTQREYLLIDNEVDAFSQKEFE